jgi:ketosteroid isomerase-like protein
VKAGTLVAVGALLIGLVAGGCGGDDEETEPGTVGSQPAMRPAPPPAEDPEAADADRRGAAGEASPEASATGPETGELPSADEDEVDGVIRAYVAALNGRDAPAVCAAFAPRAIRLSELPVPRGGCVGSLRASIGTRPAGGGPAWQRTRVVEIGAVSLEGGGARATATVLHRFRDRRQPSIEEDVIYLERRSGRWLLAKPSATFYRAVGYADPPLRALTPP